MHVAADAGLEIRPALDEARALARDHSVVPLRHTFIADTETPVSAYLKLRGSGPSFLLESAEGGQRVGRWSFLGVQQRSVIRLDGGVLTVDGSERPFDDPYAAVTEELARYRAAPLADLPPFAGGAVGLFGYDLVRWAEPTVGTRPNDEGVPELALMVSDVLLAFDHLRREVTILANLFAGDDLERAYADAASAIADVRERLSGPVPRVRREPCEPPRWQSNVGNEGYARGVDLARNDLGRVSEYGSVTVDELMAVETYSHVMHIVSEVSGTLRDGVTAMDALRASLPAGTLSGAPKIRAMQIIDELEPDARGPYGGAVGYLSYTGDLDTCIYIRSALVKDGKVHIQAGAGIVADSDPDYEVKETEAKAEAVMRAIALACEQGDWA